MKITAYGTTKNVKLYGIKVTHYGRQANTTLYIGNSMQGVTKPVAYSLSYNSKYQDGQVPRSTKSLANALSGTGSYWSNTSSYDAMSAEELAKAVEKICEDDKAILATKLDAYVSVYDS